MTIEERLREIAKRIEVIRDSIAEHGILDYKIEETKALTSELKKTVSEIENIYKDEGNL